MEGRGELVDVGGLRRVEKMRPLQGLRGSEISDRKFYNFFKVISSGCYLVGISSSDPKI